MLYTYLPTDERYCVTSATRNPWNATDDDTRVFSPPINIITVFYTTKATPSDHSRRVYYYYSPAQCTYPRFARRHKLANVFPDSCRLITYTRPRPDGVAPNDVRNVSRFHNDDYRPNASRFTGA